MKGILDLTNLEKFFHPISKSVPFEILPFVEKPIIEFFMLELIESGIKNILIAITSKNKITEDFFDREIELESVFTSENDKKKLNKIKTLPEEVTLVSMRMKKNGDAIHPLYQLRNYFDDELFVYIKPQYLILNSYNGVKKLIDLGIKSKSNVIGVVNTSEIDERNVKIFLETESKNGRLKIVDYLTKKCENTINNCFSPIKKYCLHSSIIDSFFNEQTKNYDIEEILFQSRQEITKKYSFLVEILSGDILDLTNTFEYVKSFTKFALTRDEYKDEFKSYIKEIID